MRSSAVDEDEDEEACSAIGIADILIESVETDVERGANGDVFDARPLRAKLVSEDFSEDSGIAAAMP